MPVYEVLIDCASGLTEQLHKGDTVELDGDVADWLNDQIGSPAVKAKTEPKAKTPEPKPDQG